MGIAVCPNLVARIHDHLHLLREGFDGVSGSKPCGLDVVLLKQLQQPWNADLTGEKPPGNIIR